MTKTTFNVWPVLDRESGRIISRSEVWGLHVEAADMREFAEVVTEHAHDLILANHSEEIGEDTPIVIVHPLNQAEGIVPEAA